jgi:hypothetical protein
MSTRCQIAIFDQDIIQKLNDTKFLLTDWEVLLYRHSDGYPDGVMPDIKPFIQEFINVRGYDSEYMGACLIVYLKHWHCGDKMPISEGHKLELNEFAIDVLCHGICKSIHPNIEYFYAISRNDMGATIYAFEVLSSDDGDLKLNLIETHEIIKQEIKK